MNLKKLREQRAELAAKMQELLDTAEAEARAMTDEESTEFDDLEKQIKDIDRTIQAEERARSLNLSGGADDGGDGYTDDTGEAEERAFANYIRGIVSEQRAENLTAGDNGAVIPSSIANKIIEKALDICPIYHLATRYNVGGTLSIPYYDESTGAVEMGYATEFQELTSKSGVFKSIELKGFLAGALTKISKSLVNNSQFDIVNYVINKMAKAVAKWIEKELLNGTQEKIEGISKAKQVVEAESAAAVTVDDLIDLQETVPDMYQPGCIWIMNKKTRTAIRKLKDKDGQYLLNKDVNARWGYTLLGADVYTSANMPEMKADAKAVVYGDMAGLAVKVSEDMHIEVLREKFATQHALGVVGWMEVDSKIENEEMIAVLKMASGE